MEDLYYNLDVRWKNIVKNWSTFTKTCVRCGKEYREIDNIGRWECLQHPLPFNYTQSGTFRKKGVWDCCGLENPLGSQLRPTGCVRADHTDLACPYLDGDDIEVPISVLCIIRPPSNASLIDPRNPREAYTVTKGRTREFTSDFKIRIRRYDWKEADRRIVSGTSRVVPNDIPVEIPPHCVNIYGIGK